MGVLSDVPRFDLRKGKIAHHGRILAEVDQLVADQRHADAVEVLTRTLSGGLDAVLLRKLAWVEGRQDRGRVAVALLDATNDMFPSDPDVVSDYAGLLLDRGRFRDAFLVLAGVPEPVRRDAPVREVVTRLNWVVGRTVLPEEGRGDPQTLAEPERSWWRRMWWRSGEPFRALWRHRPSAQVAHASTAAISPAPDLPTDLEIRSVRVRRLVDEIRAAEPLLAPLQKLYTAKAWSDADDVLLQALSSDDCNVLLLRELADVEWWQDHNQVALALYSMADQIAGEDLDSVADKAWALVDLGRFRQAQALLTRPPAAAREDREIRSTLGWFYRRTGLRALAVDAFGDSHTLGKSTRQERRRLWWRTGGPLRSVRQRQRRLDNRRLRAWPANAGASPDAPVDLRAVLVRVGELADEERLVARAEQLVKGGEYGAEALVDAVQVLAPALSLDGCRVLLLRKLAEVEWLQDHNRESLVLHAVADGIAGTNLWAVAGQAGAFADLRWFKRAEALLTGLPDPARQHMAIRVALAEVYRRMRLWALAVDAFGDRRSLSKDYRQKRRRLWWRTGGPLWFVRQYWRRRDTRKLRAWPADDGAPTERPVELRAVLVRVRELADEDRLIARAEQLREEGEFTEAFRVLTGGGAATGISGTLRAELAWIEFWQGQNQAVVAHLREARDLDPSDLWTARMQVGLLSELERFRDALAVLDGLPEAHRIHPRIRDGAGRLYRAMGLHALACEAFGDPRTLEKVPRRKRAREWWLSGGPLSFIRKRVREFDKRVLVHWREDSRSLRVLDELRWPQGFDQAEERSRVDGHLQRSALLSLRWRTVWRWAVPAASVGALAVAAAAVLLMFLRAGSAPAEAYVWAYVAGAIASVITWGLVRRIDARGWWRVVLRGGPPGLALLAGVASIRLAQPSAGRPGPVGIALLVAGGIPLSVFGVTGMLNMVERLHLRRQWRRSPREEIIADLLDILDQSTDASMRNDLGYRATWRSFLCRAAGLLQRPLLVHVRVSDLAVVDWAAERPARAAGTLRRLDRLFVTTVEGDWEHLAKVLRRDVVALATGRLGDVYVDRSASTNDPHPHRRTRRQIWADVQTAAILVMVMAGFVAIQRLLGLPSQALGVAATVTLVLAVVTLLPPDSNLRQWIGPLIGRIFSLNGFGWSPADATDRLDETDVRRDWSSNRSHARSNEIVKTYKSRDRG